MLSQKSITFKYIYDIIILNYKTVEIIITFHKSTVFTVSLIK